MTYIQQPVSGHLSGNPPFAPSRRLCVKPPASSHDQSPIKAKSPAIVPHQGSSRHPLKNENSPHRRAIPTRMRLLLRHWMLDVGCWMFRPDSPSAFVSVHLRSKFPFGLLAAFVVPRHTIRLHQGKNPCNRASSRFIKPYQGKLKFSLAILSGNSPPASPSALLRVLSAFALITKPRG